MENAITDNTEKKQFELTIDGATALVEYRLVGTDGIAYLHTEVPEEMGGKGIGKQLAEYVLTYAQNHQLKVYPYCPFIKKYIDRHPEFQPLVAGSFGK